MLKLLSRAIQSSQPIAWALLILLLPLTSLPWMARLARSEMVAAPAALPMLYLTVVFLIPFVWRRGGFPAVTKPLAGFAAVALIATSLAWFREVPIFKDRSILSRETQQIFTLLVGLAFYLVTTAWLKDAGRQKMTFRLINIAGLAIILWSAVQAYFWYVGGGYPSGLSSFQELITMRRFFPARVNGFALEPSWLAHQLNMLFLPYWLAASMQGYSAWRKVWRISAENLLLAGGAATLFLSFSRVGILAFMLATAYLIMRASVHFTRRVYQWVQNRRKSQSSQGLVKSAVYALMLLAFLSVYLAGAAGVVAGASKLDPRVARIFEKPEDSIFSLEYANQLAFAERMIYWATGWEIFNDHPVIGVGLGMAGYYFPEEMPSFGWYLPEIRDLIYRAEFIPNTKSLWSRLLAETGMVGFAFFAVWLVLLWQSARLLRARPDGQDRVVGLMGAILLVAMLVEGFSVDSFALPYWWISLGILTASAGRALNNPVNRVKSSVIEVGEAYE